MTSTLPLDSFKVVISFGKFQYDVEVKIDFQDLPSSFENLQRTLAALSNVPPSQQKLISKGVVIQAHNLGEVVLRSQTQSPNPTDSTSPKLSGGLKWMLLRTGHDSSVILNPPPISQSQPMRIAIFGGRTEESPSALEDDVASAPDASTSPLLSSPLSAQPSSSIKILYCEPNSDEWWDPVHHSDLNWWKPVVDVVETEHQVTVYAELPGVAIDKVVVNISQEFMFISGTKQEKNFQRRIQLPPAVHNVRNLRQTTHSEYRNGLLTIRLVKPGF